MNDYKSTLNLPQTDFPMKANLAQREPEVIAYWESIQLYQQLRQQGENRPKFILHDGPPYANGHTHIGHAVNKTLKDIVVKAKTLSGFDAPYVPGWDCHGLPIELNVEKKFGKAGTKLSAQEFRQQCRLYAAEQLAIQRQEFIRLGVVGDWPHPYQTMDYKFEADIIRALAHVIANGHLQRGSKPVHWCIDCSSALAEAEVEYANKTSPAIDVSFQVVDPQELINKIGVIAEKLGEGSIHIPIWTTTPWTLPANQAVAVHPDHSYVLVKVATAQGPQRMLVAAELLVAILQRYGWELIKVISEIKGDALAGIKLRHPFAERLVPIVLGDHVTTDTGTGAVHIAPAHGQDDYLVGLKYDLPMVNPVANNGCYHADVPLFAGMHVLQANAAIINLLRERGVLLSEQKLEHSYPHCWRHKTPLIFLATPQWFISMQRQGLRQQALQAIEAVQWVPSWGQGRITAMIEQRPDWCISRQRAWGVPLPLFVHQQTGELHPHTLELLEKVAQLVEQNGVDAWYELEPSSVLGSAATDYYKVKDVLDVWFDSGASHFAVLRRNPQLTWPADLYLEGSDQHRGWFQTSLLTAVGMYQQAPYKAVLTHGFTVDEKGRKMSKSLGNVIAPEKIINSLGADILRLWIAATDYRGEMAVSSEILTRTAEAYRRIRNTTRFLLANLHDFDPEQHLIKFEQMLALDQWLIDRARLLQADIIKAYEQYEFHLIYQKLHNFCIIELGGFYLDIIKDRQYTSQKESIARRSAQTALYHVAEAMVRWFAPILTFTAEEVWRYLPGKRPASVLLTTWYSHLTALPQTSVFSDHYWQQVIRVRDAVNKELEKQRSSGIIGSGLAAEVVLYVDENYMQLLSELTNELRFVLITSAAEVLPLAARTDTAQYASEGLYIEVKRSAHEKCIRCWHHRADIGTNVLHLAICGRCIENISGNGEQRHYA